MRHETEAMLAGITVSLAALLPPTAAIADICIKHSRHTDAHVIMGQQVPRSDKAAPEGTYRPPKGYAKTE